MTNKEMNLAHTLFSFVASVYTKGKLVKAGIWQGSDSFKDYDMYVRRNVEFKLDVENINLEKLGADLPWAEDHFQERIGGRPTNPGEQYKHWPYATFNEDNDPYKDGKKFSHTYQERYWPKKAGERHFVPLKGIRYELGDLGDVIKQLEDNPLTRQAYLPIFFPEDTGAVHGQRVPCTLGYYFWVEDNKLHCNYLIRSCDVLRHFRNDVYLTIRLLQYIANKLGYECGELFFICFNLHVFQNDLFALKKKENQLWKTISQ